MRIEVDFDVCADHGQCAIPAPEIFRIDHGRRLVLDASPGDALRAGAEAATDACPEQAITILG
jgi:ferredoxin